MKKIYSPVTKILFSILILQLVIISANAQWSTDPTVNNAICIAQNNQWNQTFYQYQTVVSDGSGGAIITWEDYRGGTTSDIYAQRINASGLVQWTTEGVSISTAAIYQRNPTIVSDGSGGAIITWWDNRNLSNIDIYAQRINASGVVQWTTDGVLISTASTTQRYPSIVSDGSGGAIITWEDHSSVSQTSNIYAQHINANGVVQWTADGVAISTVVNNQESPTIVSDENGGAIITWRDGRSGISSDIYAQRINASGVVQWTADGVAISTAANNQDSPTLVSDGNGGAIITWTDYRNGIDIYAQHINASGTVQWSADGVTISTAANNQNLQAIISDGSGGAIITWTDYRSGTSSDIYAQQINAGGTVQWTADGVEITTATNDQQYPTIVSDGSSGVIITWEDRRSGVYNIHAQRINVSGVIQWTINGVAISTATGQQQYPSIVIDGSGGAILTWRDYRNGATSDIYAQRVNADGNLGNIATGVEEQPELIHNLNLAQNYPNPFKQSTKIKYEIVTRQVVSLKVYDLFGKEIKSLANEVKPAGIYEVEFDGSGITPGIYVYKLQTGSFGATKKMTLVK